LSVAYRNNPAVLRDLALDVHAGEVVGLVGESGSGKSSLVLAILCLLHLKGAKVQGEVMFQGKNLLRMTQNQLRTIRGREISIVLQSPATSLNPALRIGAQMEEAWRAHAQGSQKERLVAIRSALRSVSLPDSDEFLARRPTQISIGQGQRVTIAMAILHKPSLLIADEATSALDSITQAEILALFRRLNTEMRMAILYISHDLLSVAAVCQRIAILHEGRIVECGTTVSIFDSPSNSYTKRLIAAIPNRPGCDRLELPEAVLSEP